MRVTDLCPSPHLEALDLGDKIGDERIFVISNVEIREVGQDKVKKGVVLFKDFDRGFVLNKTNSRTIASLWGSDTKAWIGKRIALYRSETAFQGKTVPCVRVRDKRIDKE